MNEQQAKQRVTTPKYFSLGFVVIALNFLGAENLFCNAPS
jgi:hypothetical protein